MQSQIYLNFAEAMPIDGGTPVTTAPAKNIFYCYTKSYPLTVVVVTGDAPQRYTLSVYKFPHFPHFPKDSHFPLFPKFPLFPTFPKDSPFPTIPTDN